MGPSIAQVAVTIFSLLGIVYLCTMLANYFSLKQKWNDYAKYSHKDKPAHELSWAYAAAKSLPSLLFAGGFMIFIIAILAVWGAFDAR